MIHLFVGGQQLPAIPSETCRLHLAVQDAGGSDVVAFGIAATDIRVVSDDGSAVRRILLLEEGQVVANLVNVDQGAYEVALSWLEACDNHTYHSWQKCLESERYPSVLCRRIWKEMTAAVKVVGAHCPVVATEEVVKCHGHAHGPVARKCGWEGPGTHTVPPLGSCPDCDEVLLAGGAS